MFKPLQSHSPAKQIRRILKFDASTESSPSSIQYNEINCKETRKGDFLEIKSDNPFQGFKQTEYLPGCISKNKPGSLIRLLQVDNDASYSEHSTPTPLKLSHKKSSSLENGFGLIVQTFMRKSNMAEDSANNFSSKFQIKDVEVASPALPHLRSDDDTVSYKEPSEVKAQNPLTFINEVKIFANENLGDTRKTAEEVEQETLPLDLKHDNFLNSILKIPSIKRDSKALYSRTWPLKINVPSSNEIVCSEALRDNHGYELLGVVGEGSFGTVYKCMSKADLKVYALKRSIKKAKGAYHLTLALNEVNNLKVLGTLGGHPNVIKYDDSWIENQSLSLIMEYCPSNLKQLWKEQEGFTEEEIHHILSEIAKGLKFLHSNDILHLDIKPENILIDQSNNFKLADFGQSCVISPDFKGDVEEGDGRYMAPELLNLKNEEKTTERLKKSDIFSLGMTLYEIATNSELPARGSEWQALRNGEFEALDKILNISYPLKSLIKRMLDRTPLMRPTADDILQYVSDSRNTLKLIPISKMASLKETKPILNLHHRSNSL